MCDKLLHFICFSCCCVALKLQASFWTSVLVTFSLAFSSVAFDGATILCGALRPRTEPSSRGTLCSKPSRREMGQHIVSFVRNTDCTNIRGEDWSTCRVHFQWKLFSTALISMYSASCLSKYDTKRSQWDYSLAREIFNLRSKEDNPYVWATIHFHCKTCQDQVNLRAWRSPLSWSARFSFVNREMN